MFAIAALALFVPFISCAGSAVVTNPDQTTFNRSSFYMMTALVTNVTTANHTTTAPVTNATAANHTTMAPVTNATTAKHNTTSAPTEVPTLSPTATFPVTGFYNVSLKNTLCIKMAIGIQLIVGTKSKNLYFNVPPSKTTVSGKCGNTTTWINLQFNSGFVNFTFRKDGNQYYISEIRVTLQATNNMDKTYHGIAKNMKLFNAELGYSYKCKSKKVVHFSTDSLQILMVDTQVQAFSISGGMFGKAEECFVDYKSVLPIIFGVVLAVLIIITIALYLICRRFKAAGYQRI